MRSEEELREKLRDLREEKNRLFEKAEGSTSRPIRENLVRQAKAAEYQELALRFALGELDEL